MTPTLAAAWKDLDDLARTERGLSLRELFANDTARFSRFSCRVGGLLFDYSKQRISEASLAHLLRLAEAAEVSDWRERLFAGEAINTSEDRAALHFALRRRGAEPLFVRGVDVMPEIRATQTRLREFSDAVRSGRWRGYSGEPIRAIVNLGIGGSDLGPRMLTTALRAIGHPTLAVHYVANVDSADLAPLLETLDPRTTLFIVASKTFTTLETLTNAVTAREWLIANAGDSSDGPERTAQALARQFVAVTARSDTAISFGIAPDMIFPFSDWVGGRFSLWSSIGLPLVLAIGMDAFEQLLAGAAAMDKHFRTAPARENLPLLMALVGVWNSSVLGASAYAVVPYSQSLALLPDYLQQLEMESNGKSIGRDGQPLQRPAAPAIFGGAGTNAQHAWFQLLHQGGRLLPVDFVAIVESDYPLPGHHERLLASCFAQSEALAFGEPEADPAYRRCPGNQPSSTFVLPRLDPYHLGALLAAYEHKTFVQGVLWGINSFDQWGVELGKHLAQRLLPAIESNTPLATRCDTSTAGLIAHCRAVRERHL
ncbi:glucose-6-phosphate isomerase [Rhodocyclus tenuis]|uniref:Glucose-6-phosphate isomerase n=1 Tax=Rhodocyclus gracilis TaxID=2929842 RepID=A0ABX0WIH1_9RHOO|nr:glucose-6-phosphate isomerase [Rhodocyclus gracilis]NJA88248.1 glucose-6-phosphate isomerase [Rhodocyclus gracilis]